MTSATEVGSSLDEKGKGRAVHDDEEEEESAWTCHICLQEANDPVVTLCGHLFCWADLLEWFDAHPHRPAACPVCKSASGRDKVVPIYGRGRAELDPRDKPTVPRPRANAPPAVAPPPPPSYRHRGFVDGMAPFFGGAPRAQAGAGATSDRGGFQVQAGLFPFPGFGFTFGGPMTPAAERGQPDQALPAHPALQFGIILLMSWLFMQILFG